MPQPVAASSTSYQDAHLTVDLEREAAYLDGAHLELTNKVFSLLAFLVRHPGELVPRHALLWLVWGYRPEIRTRTLDVHIRRLRQSLRGYGTTYIETVFGIGYRFQPCRAPAPDARASKVPALGASSEASSQRKTAGRAMH